jgi:hypothetical protein
LRKSAIGLAILLFLVLAGLIVVPALIDLDALKPRIAAQLAAETGRSVELQGPLALSLLPGLTVTAHDVRLANAPGAAAKDMVRLRALEVKPAFWPLLRGAFEIRSARLIQPEIELERLTDGKDNWHFTPTAASQDVFALVLERCAIEDGTVIYRSSGVIERFEHIDAALAFAGADGPFDASGTLISHGASLSFTFTSGALDGVEVPLRATVSAKPSAQLELDAVLAGAAEDRHVKGKLKVTAENFQAVATTLSRMPVPAALAQSFALTGEFTGSSRGMALDKLRLDLGAAHGEGRLSLDFGAPPALALKLSVGRLDLDRWTESHKPALPAAAPVPRDSAAVAAVDPTAPLPLAPQAIPPLKTKIELGVDTLFWRGGLIRNARLDAKLDDAALTIERLTALLPGGANLSLSGSARLEADGAHAEGRAEAGADDLRSLLGWLGVDASAVPADRLRKMTLSTRVSLAGDRLELADIAASLDTTSLTGAATVALRRRPGIGLRLALDRFSLDAYLPSDQAPNAVRATESLSAALSDFDANIDASITALTWRGQPLGDVHIAATLQDDALSIHDLSVGDLGGAHGSVSGTIDASGKSGPKGALSFDLQGPEFEHVLRILSSSLATGRFYGEFHVSGALRSDGDSLAFEAALDILGGRARVAGKLAGGQGDLTLDLDHPSFATLMRQVIPSYQPAGDPGELKLSAHLLGTPARFTVDPLGFAIGPATADGHVELRMDEARPKLAVRLKLGAWRIDALLPRRQTAMLDGRGRNRGLRPGVMLAEAQGAAEPLDRGVLALADVDLDLAAESVSYGQWRLDNAALGARLENGSLTLSRLTGGVFGGSLDASGRIEQAATPGLDLQVALKDADLEQMLEETAGIRAVMGRLDGEAHLQSAGEGPGDLIAHLAGEGTFKAHDGRIAGIDLVAIDDRLSVPERPPDLVALLRSGAGGQTGFSALAGSFHIADGVARSDDLHLVAEAGEGRAAVSVDLRQGTLSSRIALDFPSIANAPPLGVTIDGPLAEPRVIFDTNALQRFLEQRQPH